MNIGFHKTANEMVEREQQVQRNFQFDGKYNDLMYYENIGGRIPREEKKRENRDQGREHT